MVHLQCLYELHVIKGQTIGKLFCLIYDNNNSTRTTLGELPLHIDPALIFQRDLLDFHSDTTFADDSILFVR